MEFDRDITIFDNVPHCERRNPSLGSRSGWDNNILLPKDLHSDEATVLIITACTGNPSFLNVILEENLPMLAFPCPVVLEACEGPDRAMVYWEDSVIPENVSDEALQAESEQLLYCHTGEKGPDEEKRRWLKEIRCIRLERENRFFPGGLRLILLTGGYWSILKQFSAVAPSADAIVFVGPGMRTLDALGQRFLSNFLYGAFRQDVFFVMDHPDFEQEERSDMLRHYLAPVFAGKGGIVDEALYSRRVFFMDSRAATRDRSGEPCFAPPAHGKPETIHPMPASGMPAFKAELFRTLSLGRRLIAGA